MSLYEELERAKTEEDVKDAYIKALGLKGFTKGLIDIQTKEAVSVLNAGKLLWRAYFAHKDEKSVREKYKLNRADVGWYQIRNALKARNASGDFTPVSFSSFEACYRVLSDKLRPLVYEYGFLK